MKDAEKLHRGLVLLALAGILYCVSKGLIFLIITVVLAIAGIFQVGGWLFSDYLWWFKK